jgi:hypothetical protein
MCGSGEPEHPVGGLIRFTGEKAQKDRPCPLRRVVVRDPIKALLGSTGRARASGTGFSVRPDNDAQGMHDAIGIRFKTNRHARAYLQLAFDLRILVDDEDPILVGTGGHPAHHRNGIRR